MKLFRIPLVLLALGVALAGSMTEPKTLTGDFRTHDPTMIRTTTGYYVLSTGDGNGIGDGSMQIRHSKDLKDWSFVGTVFETQPSWIKDSVGTIPGNLWAPDISQSKGKILVYYAASSFGTNQSAIGLVTNTTLDPKSPDYKWVDEGFILGSTPADNYNAIDPDRFVDKEGNHWLLFGSFWDGIKMRRLDGQTNKLSSKDTTLYSLATRGGGPIEAPTLLYSQGYYYLFVAFDFCCRGVNSSYRIMVGRSKNVTGPYLDRAGLQLAYGGGTEVLSSSGRFIGPGGQDVLQDGNQAWLVHHYYDADAFGDAKLDIRLIQWKDGWPNLRARQ